MTVTSVWFVVIGESEGVYESDSVWRQIAVNSNVSETTALNSYVCLINSAAKLCVRIKLYVL